MTRHSFDRLENFSLREKDEFGRVLEEAQDIELVDGKLMHMLDDLTTLVKREFDYCNPIARVISITSGKHTDGSQHYLGRAVDVYFKGLSLYQMFEMACLFPFKGVGFYPYVRTIPPYVHLDVRQDQWPRDVWYRKANGDYVFNDYKEVFLELKGAMHKSCLNGVD